MRITDLVIADGQATVASNQPTTVRIDLDVDDDRKVLLHLGITEGPAAPIIALDREVSLGRGRNRVVVELAGLPLGRGRYAVWMGASTTGRADELIPWHPEADIEVTGPAADPAPPGVSRVAPVQVGARWLVEPA